jgi:hypothetical protein
LRTFHAVFPHVLLELGPGHYGFLMVGSAEPLELRDDAILEVLSRPNVLEDLSTAYDSPAKAAQDWAALVKSDLIAQGDEIRRIGGDGPLITDDHPLPEYFLLRRLYGEPSPRADPANLAQLLGR